MVFPGRPHAIVEQWLKSTDKGPSDPKNPIEAAGCTLLLRSSLTLIARTHAMVQALCTVSSVLSQAHKHLESLHRQAAF